MVVYDPQWLQDGRLAYISLRGADASEPMVVEAAPGMTPEEVEARITAPIEVELLGIPRQVMLRSIAKYALSDITIDFDDGTDIYWARQQVTERLAGVWDQLPADIEGGVAPMTTPLGEMFMFTVEGDLDIMERRSLLDWVIRPALRTVPGLTISSSGGRGGTTSLYTRGGEDNYTKVLIDGVSVNLGGGAYDFGRLQTANIERIEIVRGPQSALYVSDAITGVINIITKDPGKEPDLTIDIMDTSHRESNGNITGSSGSIFIYYFFFFLTTGRRYYHRIIIGIVFNPISGSGYC